MKGFIARFAGDVSGTAAVEYGILLAGIGLAITAGVQAVGAELAGTFSEVQVAARPGSVSAVFTATADAPASSAGETTETALQYGAAASGFAVATRSAARIFRKG